MRDGAGNTEARNEILRCGCFWTRMRDEEGCRIDMRCELKGSCCVKVRGVQYSKA